MNRKSTARRTVLILLGSLLILALSLALCGAVYFHHLLNRIHYVDPDAEPTLSQEELDAYLQGEPQELPDGDTPAMDPEDVQFGSSYTQIGGEQSDIVNILLIGQDRQGQETRARSDTMILCTFHKDTKKLTMTSFLRDLYVQIPGYQDNRLNVAYAAGGMSLLNKTLEKNFGLHIDGNVEVDFAQFSKIIDLLGGVSISLRRDEARWINQTVGGSLSEGTQLLSGEQALAYARIRKLDSDGDFSRTNRQRKLLTSLLDAYKNSSLTTLLALLEDILPMITTDMTETELIRFATDLFPMLNELDIASQRIPADGTYSGRMIRGMSVLVADMDAARQLLEETLGSQ